MYFFPVSLSEKIATNHPVRVVNSNESSPHVNHIVNYNLWLC